MFDSYWVRDSNEMRFCVIEMIVIDERDDEDAWVEDDNWIDDWSDDEVLSNSFLRSWVIEEIFL
jgi:hypothetical protein